MGRPGLVRLLGEMAQRGDIRWTLYLRPDAPSTRRPEASLGDRLPSDVADVLEQVGDSETGAVIFGGDSRAVAVEPPFPLQDGGYYRGLQQGPLRDLLGRRPLIGVVLLRLGRYAVGVLRGEELVASRTGTRYVKSRHRAGGSSQRRFERSRERLVRELYDKACTVCQEVFRPFGKTLDYVLLGGEGGVLRGYLARCPYLERTGARRLDRVLEVDRPGRKALERIAYQVWKSRVLSFERTGDPVPPVE